MSCLANDKFLFNDKKKDIQQFLTILTYAKSRPCQYPSNKYHNRYLYIIYVYLQLNFSMKHANFGC